MTTTRTEYDFGAEYARSLPPDERIAVDVGRACTSIADIPDGDYHAMIAAGIANPSPRAYWKGFNSECD